MAPDFSRYDSPSKDPSGEHLTQQVNKMFAGGVQSERAQPQTKTQETYFNVPNRANDRIIEVSQSRNEWEETLGES